jgi:serine/threonine-protein kinase
MEHVAPDDSDAGPSSAVTEPRADALPERGSVFAEKYLIESELGRGAAGVVLSAVHTELCQHVAIKLLRSGDTIAAERLLREARAALALQSEHVVRVMDVGRDDGRVFVVMEQLAGADLKSMLDARGTFPVAEAVDFVLQACVGVAEAHSRGIVHRDLKPSNLFLTKRADGSSLLKVLDFGISKMEADDTEASLTGSYDVLGSPLYMSPEQVRGARNVDPRTDIWSLGVILYRFVTGVPPFGAGLGATAVLAAVVAEEPRPPEERSTDLPQGLGAVIMQCLRKSPEDRFASIAELAAALAPFGTDEGRLAVARLLRGSPAGVAPVATRPSTPRWRRVALLSFVACVLTLAAVTFAASRARTAPPAAATSSASVEPPATVLAASPIPSSPTAPASAAALPSSVAAAEPGQATTAPAPASRQRPANRSPSRPASRSHPSDSSGAKAAAVNDRY